MQSGKLQLTKALICLFFAAISVAAFGQKPVKIKSFQKISNSYGSLGFTMFSDDKFGDEIANMGDLDGDGVADLAVGADFDNTGSNDNGCFYILYMNKDNTVKSKVKNSSTNLPFTLPNGARFGIGIANIGDLNKDGITDIAVGALGENSYTGAVYICFMKSNGTVSSAKRIAKNVNGFTGALTTSDYFGHGIAFAGDVDGDGVGDLVIGAPGDDDGGSQKGAAYILFMKTDGTVKGNQKISDKAGNLGSYLDFNDWFGITVDGIGDFDKDGVPDIAVGAYLDDDGNTDAGAFYILNLKSDGTVKTVTKISGSTANFGILKSGSSFGVSLDYLSDFKFPNVRAFAVGCYNESDIGTSRGAVILVYLDTLLKVIGYQRITDSTKAIKSELDNGDKFGTGLVNYGDFDTSSTQVLAVGAPFDDDGTSDAGAVYVIHIKKYDLKVDTIFAPKDSICANAQERVGVVFTNNGFNDVYNVPFRLVASGAGNFTMRDTFKGPIKAGLRDTFYFSSFLNTATSGSFKIKMFNDLEGDIFKWNDSAERSIYIIPSLNAINLGVDTNLCGGQTYDLDAGNAGATFKWSTGATTQKIVVSTSGKYWVEASKGKCSVSDTVSINYLKSADVQLGKDTILCDGDSLQLDMGYPDADNHNWTRIGTPFVQNTQKLTIKTAGKYVATVKYGHCLYRDTIDVSFLKIIVDLGKDTSLCEGDIYTIDAKNTGSTFLWNTNETTQTIDVTKSGTYNVTVMRNGCQGTGSVKVTFVTVPMADLGKDTILCQGEALLLDAKNPGSKYMWNNTVSDSNRTKSITTAGLYYVKVSNRNHPQCFTIDSIIVNFTVLNGNIGPDKTFCKGESFTLDAGNAGSTYEWSTGEVSQTITVSQTDTYSVIIKNGRCEVRDTAIISFRQIDDVDFGYGDTLTLCAGETVTLNGGNPSATHLWSNGASTPSIVVSQPGRYWDKVTVDGGKCLKGDTLYVQYIYLKAKFPADTILCQGQTLTLDATNPSGSKYLWSTGDTMSPKISVTSSGTYWVQVTNNNCVVGDTINVTFQDAPQVDIGVDTFLCWGDTLTLDAGTDGIQYIWSTGDTTQTINVTRKGNYWVVVKNENCQTFSERQIKYYPPFSHSLKKEVFLCGAHTLGDTLFPGPAESYLWLPSGDTTPYLIVNEPGTITFVIKDRGGCTIVDSVKVTNCPPTEIFIPTAFSPDGDGGMNEIFRIYNFNATDFKMMLYNRWGERVYMTDDPEQGWDGIWKGRPAMEGVYTYIITYRLHTEDGKVAKKVRKGDFTLIRH